MLRQRHALRSALWWQGLHGGDQRCVARAPRRVFGALAAGVARIDAGDVQGNSQCGASCLRVADKIFSRSLQAVVHMDGLHLARVKAGANMQQHARICAAAIGHRHGQRHAGCGYCGFEGGCA